MGSVQKNEWNGQKWKKTNGHYGAWRPNQERLQSFWKDKVLSFFKLILPSNEIWNKKECHFKAMREMHYIHTFWETESSLFSPKMWINEDLQKDYIEDYRRGFAIIPPEEEASWRDFCSRLGAWRRTTHHLPHVCISPPHPFPLLPASSPKVNSPGHRGNRMLLRAVCEDCSSGSLNESLLSKPLKNK